MSQRRLQNVGIAVVIGGVFFSALVRAEPLRTILVLSVFAFGVYEYWRAGKRAAAIGSVAFVIVATALLLLIVAHNL